MFNKLYIILIAFAFVGCETKNNNVIDSSVWKDGERLIFNVVQTEIKLNNDSVFGGKKQSYKAILTLSSIDSNIISWSVLKPIKRHDSLTSMLDVLNPDTVDYIQDLEIIYKVDSLGRYQEIVNWEQVEVYADSIWELNFLESKEESTFDEERYESVKATFLNRSSIESWLARDIMSFHFAYGHDYSDTITQNEMIIAGFNNAPINSEITCQVIERNTDNLILTFIQKLESNQVANQINDFYSSYIESFDFSTMDVVDTCMVDFNLNNGFPNQVEYWRTASLDSLTKQTFVSILKVPY